MASPAHAARAWSRHPTFDRYFSATLAETYPNRFYQHSARADRIHNSTATATMPTIWDRLAGKGVSRAYYVDVPFLALYGTKYLDISADDHPHADIRAGQSFINQVYEAITRGAGWSRTALVVNYDEWAASTTTCGRARRRTPLRPPAPADAASVRRPCWSRRGRDGTTSRITSTTTRRC